MQPSGLGYRRTETEGEGVACASCVVVEGCCGRGLEGLQVLRAGYIWRWLYRVVATCSQSYLCYNPHFSSAGTVFQPCAGVPGEVAVGYSAGCHDQHEYIQALFWLC